MAQEKKESYAEVVAHGHQNGHMETPVVTSIAEVPVTVERKPFLQPEDNVRLPHTGTPRANIAATYERPEGTTENGWASRHKDKTVLQQHCEFFDRDRDGIIWPQDTYVGFRALGFNILLSLLAVFIIHANFSYPTVPGYLPDPFFRLYVNNIHKAKHGSDSGTYDTEGRFVPQKFEDVFEKYAAGKDTITLWDVTDLWKGQRLIADPIGWGGAFFEWIATYLMLWPEDGHMRKEDIRGIYDGISAIAATLLTRQHLTTGTVLPFPAKDQLRDWSTQRKSTFLVTEAKSPQVAKDFNLGILGLLHNSDAPTVWALRYTNYWETKLDKIGILRMLVTHALQINENAMKWTDYPITTAHLREASTQEDGTQLFHLAVSGMAQVFVMLDTELLTHATARSQYETTKWLGELLLAINSAVVKVVVYSARSELCDNILSRGCMDQTPDSELSIGASQAWETEASQSNPEALKNNLKH
ncbi:Peroxygenase [Paramyrothecium foliicola]|nr:Peroxygenase [Paramyrothecium foliicola]